MYDNSNLKKIVDSVGIFSNDSKSESEFFIAYYSLFALKYTINEVLTELNLSEARSYGLNFYEDLFGYDFSFRSREERHRRLIERFSNTGMSCNKKTLAILLDSLGIEGDYTYNYPGQTLTIHLTNDLTKKEINFAKYMLDGFLPCGFTVNIE